MLLEVWGDACNRSSLSCLCRVDKITVISGTIISISLRRGCPVRYSKRRASFVQNLCYAYVFRWRDKFWVHEQFTFGCSPFPLLTLLQLMCLSCCRTSFFIPCWQMCVSSCYQPRVRITCKCLTAEILLQRWEWVTKLGAISGLYAGCSVLFRS